MFACRVVLWILLAVTPVGAADLTLTSDVAETFRRFIEMAQAGELGEDVSNANVGVDGPQVRLELLRPGRATKVLLLKPKISHEPVCRYFDITIAEGASASDVIRIGRILDELFTTDPFQVLGLEGSPAGDTMPGLWEAWRMGSWSGAFLLIERRMMVLASLEYTVAVIVVLGLGLLASVGVLWGSIPTRSPSASSDRNDRPSVRPAKP